MFAVGSSVADGVSVAVSVADAVALVVSVAAGADDEDDVAAGADADEDAAGAGFSLSSEHAARRSNGRAIAPIRVRCLTRSSLMCA
jgi:hypothetical protein